MPSLFALARIVYRSTVAFLLPLILWVLLLIASPNARAQVLTTLVNFDSVNGAYPATSVVIGPDGNLYGNTVFGGSSLFYGTLYRYAPTGNILTSLVNFNYGNGAVPESGVSAGADGNLYGTTYQGGINGNGTLYRYDMSANTLTTLISFNGANGAGPYAGSVIMSADGNLYGTTQQGGATNGGTLYRYNLTSGTLTTLVNFNGANGAYPITGVSFGRDGNLYGTTERGGNAGNGTLYRYNLTTGTLTTLANFNGTGGAFPEAGVTFGPDGILYGTTYQGGSNGVGTLYCYNLNNDTLTTLVHFNGVNGTGPDAGLSLGPDGNFYGTTFNGGASDNGTVYRYDPTSNTLTTIANFLGANGFHLTAGVTFDAKGNLYGTTLSGGSNNAGTLFKLSRVITAPEPGSLLLIAPLVLGGLAMRRRRAG